jgi:archaeosine-15-forming tRNA-guanine transglycosylase
VTLKGELIGVGAALMGSAAILDSEHGHAVAVRQVFMAAGTYPRAPLGGS